MVKHGFGWGLLAAGVLIAFGCDRGANAQQAPAAPPMPAMQPLPQLPQMPQPALQAPTYAPVAQAPAPLQPLTGAVDARTQWNEQRIARLEQQVAALVQDNQSLHIQLAETQEAVRRMQTQASTARRTIQGFRNQYQGQ